MIKDSVPAARKSCQQKVSFVVSDTLFYVVLEMSYSLSAGAAGSACFFSFMFMAIWIDSTWFRMTHGCFFEWFCFCNDLFALDSN